MNHDQQDLQRRFDALRERERERTPDFARVWRRAQRTRQASTASSDWRWRPAFALAAVVAMLVCAAVLWWRPQTGLPPADRKISVNDTVASLAASDWQMPSDLLLDAPADPPSLQIAGLVREIDSLLQP